LIIMTKKTTQLFRPNWTIHPGEILAEYLDALGISQIELAQRTGLHAKTINEIINGKAAISSETAAVLAPVLHRPAHFWLNLERTYQDDCIRLTQQAEWQTYKAWTTTFPLKEMRTRALITPSRDVVDTVHALLEFFGIGHPKRWAVVWQPLPAMVTCQHAPQHPPSPEHLSVWLREGQRVSEQRECPPFDATKLKATIPLLRQLTTQAPAEFWPTLETLCANAGVLVIKVPTYPRLRVYGATYRYHGKTVVQLSDTRRTVDQFWFSFFHTIGHLLLHGVKASYLASDIVAPTDTPPTPQEAEANAFAARTLIPAGALRRFIREAQATYTSPASAQFAAQQGIDPAIVVGRLQQAQAVPYHTPLNELKTSYDV
jgi:addiction module HigA family antidote